MAKGATSLDSPPALSITAGPFPFLRSHTFTNPSRPLVINNPEPPALPSAYSHKPVGPESPFADLAGCEASQDEAGQDLPDNMPVKQTCKAAASVRENEAAPDSFIDRDAGIKYWSDRPATQATMLGELGQFSWYTRIDLQGSRNFLAKVRRMLPPIVTLGNGKLPLGVDCGAGVGRVTEGFVSKVCENVDIVEPVEKFAKVVEEGELKRSGVVKDIYVMGLEDWVPQKKYDLIWVQWCVGHLTDARLLQFLRRAGDSLSETGIICLKENNTTMDGEDIYDEEDSSVTRCDSKFRLIFEKAGLKLITSEIQTGFPKSFNLLPVRSYALKPFDP
ncbi:Alpha N-terminal protein methyltransferase 1 [Ascosphaera aggregata]|nr:Alpha N-terminal protein methyltransferase 1 [Ascosphaera aggregata]